METQPPLICICRTEASILLLSFLNVRKVLLHASLTSLLARDCTISCPLSTCHSLWEWWPFGDPAVEKVMCSWKPHKYLWNWRHWWKVFLLQTFLLNDIIMLLTQVCMCSLLGNCSLIISCYALQLSRFSSILLRQTSRRPVNH